MISLKKEQSPNVFLCFLAFVFLLQSTLLQRKRTCQNFKVEEAEWQSCQVVIKNKSGSPSAAGGL